MIKGKKINLRLVQEKDIDQLIDLVNNLEQRGEYLALALTSEVMIKKHFNETGYWEDDFGRMLITDKAERILGDITFYKGVMGLEIGYQIFKKEDRMNGYATEALKLFSAFLFKLKPIHSLRISVVDTNVASKKVATRCGYKYDGTMRQAYFAHGEYHDIQVFSLLREEVNKK